MLYSFIHKHHHGEAEPIRGWADTCNAHPTDFFYTGFCTSPMSVLWLMPVSALVHVAAYLAGLCAHFAAAITARTSNHAFGFVTRCPCGLGFPHVALCYTTVCVTGGLVNWFTHTRAHTCTHAHIHAYAHLHTRKTAIPACNVACAESDQQVGFNLGYRPVRCTSTPSVPASGSTRLLARSGTAASTSTSSSLTRASTPATTDVPHVRTLVAFALLPRLRACLAPSFACLPSSAHPDTLDRPRELIRAQHAPKPHTPTHPDDPALHPPCSRHGTAVWIWRAWLRGCGMGWACCQRGLARQPPLRLPTPLRLLPAV